MNANAITEQMQAQILRAQLASMNAEFASADTFIVQLATIDAEFDSAAIPAAHASATMAELKSTDKQAARTSVPNAEYKNADAVSRAGKASITGMFSHSSANATPSRDNTDTPSLA